MSLIVHSNINTEIHSENGGLLIFTTSLVTGNQFFSMKVQPTNMKHLFNVVGYDEDENCVLDTLESIACVRQRINKYYDLGLSIEAVQNFLINKEN